MTPTHKREVTLTTPFFASCRVYATLSVKEPAVALQMTGLLFVFCWLGFLHYPKCFQECFIWSPVTITSRQTQGVNFSTLLRLWTKLLLEPHQIDFFLTMKATASTSHATSQHLLLSLFFLFEKWHIVHLFDVYMEYCRAKQRFVVCMLLYIENY